jgi:hypothetical protein
MDDVGYRVGDANQNTLRYVPDGFAPAGAALAITVLTFDAAGRLLDADIIVNGYPRRRFAVLPGDEDSNTFDLQDVLTHEAGHFFGLAHNSADAAVTMFPNIDPCEISKRELHEDDVRGLRAVYPPVLPGVSCAASNGAGPAPRWLPMAVAALGMSLARRARARRGRILALVTALGLAAIGSIATAHPAPAAPSSATIAHVVAATPRWHGGLIVTQLSLEAPSCEGCAPARESIDVLGGAVDGIEQIVTEHELPAVGAELPVRFAEGRMVLPPHVAVWRQR